MPEFVVSLVWFMLLVLQKLFHVRTVSKLKVELNEAEKYSDLCIDEVCKLHRELRHWKCNHREAVRSKRAAAKIHRQLRDGLQAILHRQGDADCVRVESAIDFLNKKQEQ